jgi:hypothetical protein
MSVIDEIAAERRRQIEVEGWTPEHDDYHEDGEMAAAASCYALPPDEREGILKGKRGHLSWSNGAPVNWPWDVSWWNPGDRRFELVRAAALIVAEIERLDRAALALAEDGLEN